MYEVHNNAFKQFNKLATKNTLSSHGVVQKAEHELDKANEYVKKMHKEQWKYDEGTFEKGLADVYTKIVEDARDRTAEAVESAHNKYSADIDKSNAIYKAAQERNQMAILAANTAKGAAAVASLASGIGSVAIVSSAAISAAQLGYAIYNKYKQKQAVKAESDETQKKKQ